MITHNEAISIADYFTLREGDEVVFRPTCHYAYHPCDDAVLSLHEMAGAAWRQQPEWKILDERDIVDGVDELGVLLYGHARNAYWYGSQLSVEETRELAPYQNATGMQVTSAVLAGIVWMLENPDRGIVEADEMDFRRCLEVQRPYLGPVDRALYRMDAGRRPRRAVPREHRSRRPLAVQQRPGALNISRSAPALREKTAGTVQGLNNQRWPGVWKPAPGRNDLAIRTTIGSYFCFRAAGYDMTNPSVISLPWDRMWRS